MRAMDTAIIKTGTVVTTADLLKLDIRRPLTTDQRLKKKPRTRTAMPADANRNSEVNAVDEKISLLRSTANTIHGVLTADNIGTNFLRDIPAGKKNADALSKRQHIRKSPKPTSTPAVQVPRVGNLKKLSLNPPRAPAT